MMPFFPTDRDSATTGLAVAVHAAVTPEHPPAVKAKPGTGKAGPAQHVAAGPGPPLLEWHVKSAARAQQGPCEHDAVSRLHDSQSGDARVNDVANSIRRDRLWRAFAAPGRAVPLIDGIDKAEIGFPDAPPQEPDCMVFHPCETAETVTPRHRAVVIVTSNNGKDLPDAFLWRCLFHFIRLPDPGIVRRSVDAHFPGMKKALPTAALARFHGRHQTPGLKERPSTGKVPDWPKLLAAEDLTARDRWRDRKNARTKPPGAALKTEQDLHLFERPAFIAGSGR